MRRLNSKKDEAKKKKRNQIVIGVILTVVMFASVFGLAAINFSSANGSSSGNSNGVEYNGYEFVNQGNYWYLSFDGKEYYFQYNPYQIQESFNITSSNLTSLGGYQGMPLYISSLSNYNAEGEVARVFNGIALRVQRACLNDTINPQNTNLEECPSELPIKDCSNNFIIIRESNDGETSITQEENCVFIEGSPENLIKATDDYLFKIMDIMK